MEWTRQNICDLIEGFRQRPALWDHCHPEYGDKAKKRECWEEIGQELNLPIYEVDRKIKILISQFKRELRREDPEVNKFSGYKSKWFAFERMMFLKANFSRDLRRSNGFQVQSLNDDDFKDVEFEDYQTIPEISSPASTYPMGLHLAKRVKCEMYSPLHDAETPANDEYVTENSQVAPNVALCRKDLKNEYLLFGELIGQQINNLSTEYAKATVQHLINNILYDAKLGNYNFPKRDSDAITTSITVPVNPTLVVRSESDIDVETNNHDEAEAC